MTNLSHLLIKLSLCQKTYAPWWVVAGGLLVLGAGRMACRVSYHLNSGATAIGGVRLLCGGGGGSDDAIVFCRRKLERVVLRLKLWEHSRWCLLLLNYCSIALGFHFFIALVRIPMVFFMACRVSYHLNSGATVVGGVRLLCGGEGGSDDAIVFCRRKLERVVLRLKLWEHSRWCLLLLNYCSIALGFHFFIALVRTPMVFFINCLVLAWLSAKSFHVWKEIVWVFFRCIWYVNQ